LLALFAVSITKVIIREILVVVTHAWAFAVTRVPMAAAGIFEGDFSGN